MLYSDDPSAKSFYIRHLQPTSNYDVFIKDCNENYLTTEVNFQTLRDGKEWRRIVHARNFLINHF